jgi:L-lysine 2,3-aminomutase
MTAPPLILNLIKNQGYNNIDEFVSVLKELLIQERIRVPYYTMKFKECMGMNHFATKTTYNFERMDALRQIND